MAFTDALDVDIGDATKASDYDNLADNTEFNRETAAVGHDFAISGGDGHHWGDYTKPTFFKDSAEDDWIALWIDDTDAENILRTKSGATEVAATPSSKTDGDAIGALTPASAIVYPDTVESDNDAHKVIFVDLDNPRFVWDWEAAKRIIRNTSWYAELGMPPVHGAFIIDASQNAVHWIDREDSSLTPYMTFTQDSNAIVSGLGSLTDIAFVDFKLLVGGNGGLPLIDFIEDGATSTNASNMHRYSGDLSERNTGGGFVAYVSSPVLANADIKSVSMIRDPNGNADHYGRPLHYWLVGTATKASLYDPINNAIYDSAAGTVPFNSVDIAPSGYYTISTDDTYDYTRIGLLPVDAITADGFGETALTVGNAGGALWSLGFPSDSAGTLLHKIYDGSIIGGPVTVGGSNQGFFIIHWPPVVNSGEHGIIKITSTYATPYMKGNRVAAYPLNDVNDRSGNSHNLTNNNTTPFTGTGPFGANTAAVFDGVNQSLSVADHADFGDGTETEITVSCYAYFDTVAGGEDTIVSKYNSGSSSNRSFALQTNNGALFFVINNSTTSYTASGITLAAGQWYHLCGTYDGATVKLYVDGILAPTTAAATGAIPNTTGEFRIGSENSNDHYFDGMISQVSVNFSAWTEDEIKLEYARMKQGLAGATATITADDVDSVRIDPDSGYAIVTAGDTAHIIDAQTGLIIATDAIGTGTLNDADIISMPGADTPHYLLGGSTTIEQVAPDVRIGG